MQGRLRPVWHNEVAQCMLARIGKPCRCCPTAFMSVLSNCTAHVQAMSVLPNCTAHVQAMSVPPNRIAHVQAMSVPPNYEVQALVVV